MGQGSMRGGKEGMMGAQGRMGMGSSLEQMKKNLVTLTRTDFMIQFIWQPPAADKPGPTIEDIRKKVLEAENDPKNREAIAAFDSNATKIEQQLEQESLKGSRDLISKAEEALKSATPPAPGSAAVATPGVPAPPVAPGAPAAAPVPSPSQPPANVPAPGGNPSAPPK